MASLLSISTPSATLTFSDIDSDAAAAILHRTIRRQSTTTTNRRTSHPPTPGTRRFRRYLNALLSADEGDGSSSDYYSASEVEREEGEAEVWRNEWRGEFVRAGEEFFDGRIGLPKHDRDDEEERKGSRLQRRVKSIGRERIERRRERRERLERKQRRLAAVEQLTTASSQSSNGASGMSGVEDGSLAMLRAQRDGVREVEDGFVLVGDEMDRKEQSINDGQQQLQEEEEDEQMMASVVAGDALNGELWRCIDKATRQLLRHMDDFTYLHALEHLLLAFKTHTHNRPNTPFQPPTLPPAAGRFFSLLPSPLAGEVVLHVSDGFLRHLLYGVLQWHVMYSAGRSGGRGGSGVSGGMDAGVVCVRMQRGCVYHQCRLERFIQQHYCDRR